MNLRIPRPNRRALSLCGAALLLFAVASNSQAGWVFVLAAALFGVAFAGALLPGRAIRRLEVSRRVPEVCRVGDRIRVMLVLSNPSNSSRHLIEGIDDFLGRTPFLVEALSAKDAATVGYEITPVRRGIYEGGEALVSSGVPFGVRRAKRKLFVTSSIVVHPRWVRIANFPLLESASTPHEIVHERRRGTGVEFYGIREYRSGDSLRHVHWRSSARTGRLYVREFEEQYASRLGILLDAEEKIGVEPNTTFEDAVACAASLAIYALEAGHPVQIFADSRGATQHLFEPSRRDALDWLAGLEADGRRGLVRIAADMAAEVQRRSTNALIFPATRRNADDAPKAAALLQARSSRVIAVMVSAFTYSASDRWVLDEEGEQALADELAANHVIVYRVSSDRELAECFREPSLV